MTAVTFESDRGDRFPHLFWDTAAYRCDRAGIHGLTWGVFYFDDVRDTVRCLHDAQLLFTTPMICVTRHNVGRH